MQRFFVDLRFFDDHGKKLRGMVVVGMLPGLFPQAARPAKRQTASTAVIPRFHLIIIISPNLRRLIYMARSSIVPPSSPVATAWTAAILPPTIT